MEEKYHHKEDFPVQFRFRRALCLLLMLFLILSAVPGASGLPAALAEDTADAAVQSAPLERSAATRDGMVRVRLLSIGSNPASLTVTAVGAMAVSGGQTMAPISVTASMFLRWVSVSGVSLAISTRRRRSLSITSAAREISVEPMPLAISASVFIEQGAITMPSDLQEPLATQAPMSSFL